MKKSLSIVFLLLILTAESQNLFYDEWISTAAFRNASVGLMVYDLDNDSVVFSANSEKNLICASTLKLVSTAAALKTLGPEFQFKTELAYTDSISSNGVLKGDLFINGFGDPTLGSKYFFEDQKSFIKQWIEEIKKAGIKSIEGNIIGNDSYLGSSVICYDWLWSDISNYYGSPAYSLNVFDNQYTISFRTKESGSPTEIINTDPFIPYLKLNNKVMASNEQKDNSFILGGPREFNKEIEGTLPANKPSFKVKGAIPDPALYLSWLLFEELKKSGISIKGKYKSIREIPNQNRKIFYTHYSPFLKEIILITNKQSNNLFAEACGSAVKMKLSNNNYQKCIESVFKNGEFNFSIINDASGLSPTDAISAKNLLFTLKSMYSDTTLFSFYKESLSISGKDGTLKNFGTNQSFNTNLIGKSGSMSAVKAYAGYLKTKSGKNIVIIIMANHFSTESTVIKGKSEELINHVFQNY